MKTEGTSAPFFAEARRPVKQADVRPRLCRLAIASALTGAAGPFTLGLLSVASIVLGVLSLRRLRSTEDPVTGRVWAMGGIGFSVLTLLVMLIVGPLGMRGSAGGCAAVFQPEFAGRARATQEVIKLREAALRWSGPCPSAQQLISQQLLPHDQGVLDPWGSPYIIVCGPGSVVVTSWGPDRRADTSDDIVAGKP